MRILGLTLYGICVWGLRSLVIESPFAVPWETYFAATVLFEGAVVGAFWAVTGGWKDVRDNN